MMVDSTFIEQWVEQLRREIPDAVAILLKGSYAHGEPSAFSDVDFDVLTAGEPRQDYPVYFAEGADRRLIHISVAVRDLNGWLGSEAEPVGWALGLPAAEATRLLWAADDAPRERLDRPCLRHPPGEPELEDFFESFGKLKHAHARGDELGLRLAAQWVARRCPSVLRPINPDVRAGTAFDALQLALDLPVSPPGYREDMLTCLGLCGRATTADDVFLAARRLVLGALDRLQPHAERLAPDLPPSLAEQLANGALRRYAAIHPCHAEYHPRHAELVEASGADERYRT